MASPRIVRQWLVRVGLVGGAALVLNGCPPDAAEITEQAVPPSQNFPIASNYVAPLGEFTIDNLIVAGTDTAVGDAFARTESFVVDEDDGISFVSGCGLAGGTQCPGIEFPMVNSTVDTRLPALQDPNATSSAAGTAGIITDSAFGDPLVALLAANLDLNTLYTLTLERVSVTVNGGLDATNNLLNNPELGVFALTPDAPDQLATVGGAYGTSLGDNPYELGTFTSSGTGTTFFLPFVTGGSDATFETNSQAPFALPFYNYMVLYRGDPQAGGVPVMRGQIGVDLNPAGTVDVNNALAPFPATFLTKAEVIGSPGGAGRPDQVSVTYSDLEELQAGVYQAWLTNAGTSSMIPATGTYNKYQIVLERDSVTGEIISSTDSLLTAETRFGTSFFVGDDSGDGFRHELIVADSSLGGGAADTVGFYTDMVLTLTVSAGGTISDSRPYFYEYTDQRGTPTNFFDDSVTTSGVTKFGNFDLAAPRMSRIYISSGAGTAGVVTSILSSDMLNLSRPPVGYVLQGWIMSGEDAARIGLGIPPTFAPVRTDDVTGPPPDFTDLTNADVDDSSAQVTPNGILEANFRLDAATVELDFTKFGFFQVTVEPKLGLSTISNINVQTGALPERIINPPEE